MNTKAYLSGYILKEAAPVPIQDTSMRDRAAAVRKRMEQAQKLYRYYKLAEKYGPAIKDKIPLSKEEVLDVWETVKGTISDKRQAEKIDDVINSSGPYRDAMLEYVGKVISGAPLPLSGNAPLELFADQAAGGGYGTLSDNKNRLYEGFNQIGQAFRGVKDVILTVPDYKGLFQQVLDKDLPWYERLKALQDLTTEGVEVGNVLDNSMKILRNGLQTAGVAEMTKAVAPGKINPYSLSYPIEREVSRSIKPVARNIGGRYKEEMWKRTVREAGLEGQVPEMPSFIPEKVPLVQGGIPFAESMAEPLRPVALAGLSQFIPRFGLKSSFQYAPKAAGWAARYLPVAAGLASMQPIAVPLAGSAVDMWDAYTDPAGTEKTIQGLTRGKADMAPSVGSFSAPALHALDAVAGLYSPVKHMSAFSIKPADYLSARMDDASLAVDSAVSRIAGARATPAKDALRKIRTNADPDFENAVFRQVVPVGAPIRAMRKPLREVGQDMEDDYRTIGRGLKRIGNRLSDKAVGTFRKLQERMSRSPIQGTEVPDRIFQGVRT